MASLCLFMLPARYAAAQPPSEAVFPLDPDGFTRSLAQALNSAGVPEPVRIVSPLTLKSRGANGTDMQINLDRVYSACQGDHVRCKEFVERFVVGTGDSLRLAYTPPTPADLRVVVRPAAYIHGNAGFALQVTPNSLPDGLIALIYADQPRVMRTVGTEDLKSLKLSTDEAYRVGLRNIAASLQPFDGIIQHLPVRGIGVLKTDPYQSSRLLLHDGWAPASAQFGGHLIVAVPSAEELFYADGSSAEAIDALSALAHDRFAKAERQISPAVFEWHPDRWVIVMP